MAFLMAVLGDTERFDKRCLGRHHGGCGCFVVQGIVEFGSCYPRDGLVGFGIVCEDSRTAAFIYSAWSDRTPASSTIYIFCIESWLCNCSGSTSSATATIFTLCINYYIFYFKKSVL